MSKHVNNIAYFVLACFIFTYALPSPAMADEIKAVDNDHVTYLLDTHGNVTTNTKFTMSITAKYDGTPMTDLGFKNMQGFQLIRGISNGEYELQAPPNGNRQFSLVMEGTANGQRIAFTVPVFVYNSAQSGTADNNDKVVVIVIFAVVGVVLLLMLLSSASSSFTP